MILSTAEIYAGKYLLTRLDYGILFRLPLQFPSEINQLPSCKQEHLNRENHMVKFILYVKTAEFKSIAKFSVKNESEGHVNRLPNSALKTKTRDI